jgi:hypothetical protein
LNTRQYDAEIKVDYDLCINQPLEYQRKVDFVNNLFLFKGEYLMTRDYAPVFHIGKLESPYALFSLNPRLRNTTPIEDWYARDAWLNGGNMHRDLYKDFRNYPFHKPMSAFSFFNPLGKLLSSLTYSSITLWEWADLDSILVNLELFPFYSKRFGLSDANSLSEAQFNYVNKNLQMNLAAVLEHKPKLLMFDGKIYDTLLTRCGLVDKFEIKNIVKNFNMYLFKIENTPCVLFNRFLGSAHFEGMKDYHLHTTIPDLIRQKFGEMRA